MHVLIKTIDYWDVTETAPISTETFVLYSNMYKCI